MPLLFIKRSDVGVALIFLRWAKIWAALFFPSFFGREFFLALPYLQHTLGQNNFWSSHLILCAYILQKKIFNSPKFKAWLAHRKIMWKPEWYKEWFYRAPLSSTLTIFGPFWPDGQQVKTAQISETTEILLKYATFSGGFFNFLTIKSIGSPQNSVF